LRNNLVADFRISGKSSYTRDAHFGLLLNVVTPPTSGSHGALSQRHTALGGDYRCAAGSSIEDGAHRLTCPHRCPNYPSTSMISQSDGVPNVSLTCSCVQRSEPSPPDSLLPSVSVQPTTLSDYAQAFRTAAPSAGSDNVRLASTATRATAAPDRMLCPTVHQRGCAADHHRVHG
jgi:hypothetical protein